MPKLTELDRYMAYLCEALGILLDYSNAIYTAFKGFFVVLRISI